MGRISDEEWERPRVKRIPLPPTAEEQAAFDAWKAEYEKIEQTGFDNGWMSGSGFEGYYPSGPRPAGYEERIETEEERLARVNSPLARATEEMFRTFLGRPTVAEMLNAVDRDPDGSGYVTLPVVTRRPEKTDD